MKVRQRLAVVAAGAVVLAVLVLAMLVLPPAATPPGVTTGAPVTAAEAGISETAVEPVAASADSRHRQSAERAQSGAAASEPSGPQMPRIMSAPGARQMPFQRDQFLGLAVGDQAPIAFPQLAKPQTLLVTRRQQHANGDISLSGTLASLPPGDAAGTSADSVGTALITLGATQAFATLAVDGRVYNLTAFGAEAWVVDAAQLGSDGLGDTAAPRLPALPEIPPDPEIQVPVRVRTPKDNLSP